MATFDDAKRDAADLAKLVNEDTDVTTRYGANPKISAPKAIRLIEASGSETVSQIQTDAANAIATLNTSRGFRDVGAFATGFTYELANDVAVDGSGNYWAYADINALPVTVPAGTTPTEGEYSQRTWNEASAVVTTAGINAQQFIDNFELKIFQSPTDNLTKVTTFAGGVGVVYEVRKTSDNSLATIYSDKDGVTSIPQNGTANVSNGDAEAVFYVSGGDYTIVINSIGVEFVAGEIKPFDSVADMKAANLQNYRENTKVSWDGYYASGDGGGNSGVLKFGAHTEDGGSIFSIDANTYIKADLNENGVVYFEQFGALNTNDNPTFDSIDAMYAAAEVSSKLKFKLARTYGISRKFTYPRSGITINGVTSAPFGSTTSLRPVDNTFPDDCLVDLNENGSESGIEGGQFNRLDDVRVFGGMADWTDGVDPLVGLTGVKFKKTRDTCGMHNVSFRNCGVPFEGEGYIHWLSKIYVFQCYEGPSLISTNSSSIDTYVIQTCAKNWGYLKNCAVHNATIQQGTEKQDLDDDVGVTCEGLVNFTGYFYSEGGNAQIYVGDNSQVSVENYHMGFTILSTAGFGHHNIRVGAGSEIVVSGGRSSGVKSFLVGGSPNSAKNIHLDINEYDGRVVNSATNEELPTCENFYIKRSYGIISRINDFNEISLNQYNIGATTVALWDQFDAGNSNPFGGTIKVQVGGSNTYDMYEIDFTDAPSQTEQVNIRTIFRNTGGSGDNNIILSYSGGALTAQGRKSDQRLTVRVSGYGELYPKPIS